MSQKRLWATTIATVFALSAFSPRPPGVWADTQATCNPGWEWNRNSRGQDPCLVVSVLESACRGEFPGSYAIPPLNGSTQYDPPKRNTSDVGCECDTVTYSLYMACTTCQGVPSQPWPTWYIECDNIVLAQYPRGVPNGTAIPRWAFINITSLPGQNYSDTFAMAVGRDPEATPTSVSTDGTSPSRKSAGGAIAGGVVVGLVLLGILVAVVASVARQRRQRREQQPRPFHQYYNLEGPTAFPPLLNETYHPMAHINTPYSPEYNWGPPSNTKAWFRSS